MTWPFSRGAEAGTAKVMIASSTIGKEVAGLAEGVPAGVAHVIDTVKERLPDSRPDVSLPEISLPELASKLPQLRRPDIDISEVTSRLGRVRLPELDGGELGERLRELPAVRSALPRRRSRLARLAVPLAVAGVVVGGLLVARRMRARRRQAAENP